MVAVNKSGDQNSQKHSQQSNAHSDFFFIHLTGRLKSDVVFPDDVTESEERVKEVFRNIYPNLKTDAEFLQFWVNTNSNENR